MSSDEAADDAEDLEHVSFILMRASETFDGQERVMSRAAYDLQVRATAHSASCGHPGFVPDDYLEHLDGLSIETTITAVELCTVGMWERVDGGYRDYAVRGMRYALSPHRAGGPRPIPRRVGALAPHCAGQHRAATRARTVVSAVQGCRRLQRLGQTANVRATVVTCGRCGCCRLLLPLGLQIFSLPSRGKAGVGGVTFKCAATPRS
jgi:hypothetical protein